MTLRRIVLGISILVLMTGCRTSLQSNWKDFNAYYNTYYNAKKSYNAGLKKNLSQVRDYNPLQPIRIHPKPVNAGAQDFDKAIQKGADVLRRHEDTKWVDNAIGLIGKSYYFKQEYFSADQKFKELYVTSKSARFQQESILWQGRVLLDLEAYREGVALLTEQLALQDKEWDKGTKAEIKALLAQHHVKLGNWQLAANELSEALPTLPNKDYRERGYFLLGQIYEELGNTEAAFDAYNQVQNHYVEYRIQYLAQRKQAEVARKLGRNDAAYRIFDRMVRDDKNLEYKAELDFELARTEHERANFERAERLYKNVLHKNIRQPTPEIAARTYYGLAEIYRFWYNDFTMAAAYYDSAAQKNVPKEKLPPGFEAGELAESFGNYARIKNEITLQDSLLRLGQLSPEEFDSVLVILKKQKLEELKKLRAEQQERENQLTVSQETEGEEATSLRNGFLNSSNPVIQENARQQFFAIWGDRPLADNWRVRSIIDYSSGSEDDSANGENDNESANSSVMTVQIDLSRIPFTKQEQDSVRKGIAAFQYELGNLFFLSLNDPDSAAYYFEKAIENPSIQNVNTVSMYSLSELYSIQGEEEKARRHAQRLIDEYPGTEYARRVSEKFDIPLNYIGELDAVDPLQLYMKITSQDSISVSEKAERLKSFSYNFTDHKIAPQALYESLQWYVVAGKEEPLYQQNIEAWRELNTRWAETMSAFEIEKDTARAMLQDTTLSEEQQSSMQALVDSTLQEPDFRSVFPYGGSHWDSARAVADTFLVLFRDSKFRAKVSRLNQELAVPEEEKVEEIEEPVEEEAESESVSEGYFSCAELETELEIRGGLQNFLSTVDFPNEIEIQEITYLFKVNQRGIIEEYTLQTQEVPDELSSAFEQAFQELNFEPVMREGQAVSVECAVSFPIQ